MGLAGNEWVKEKFTLAAFASQLDLYILELQRARIASKKDK
jgi:hypothetical protein